MKMKLAFVRVYRGNWPVSHAVVCYLYLRWNSFLALKEKWSCSHFSNQSEMIFFMSCHQNTGQDRAIGRLLIYSLKMWQSLNI